MKRLGRGLMLVGSLAGALTGLQLVACSSNSSSGDSGEAGGTQSGSGGTQSGSSARTTVVGGSKSIGLTDPSVPIGGSTSSTAEPATGDDNCGKTTSELKKKPADLLLVLDRSSSMTRAMDSSKECADTSTTCSQRWATMISSLNTVLKTAPADVYWGLKFFTTPTARGGSSGSCSVSAGVEIPIASDSAAAITTKISEAGTSSSTPTRLAIEAAVKYLDTVNDDNPKYILLATDGEPNCAPGVSSTSTSDMAGAVTAVENAAAAGYKVFVIGVGFEAANLTTLAQAGGTEDFYSASTPAQLSSALTSIVGTVAAGCTYPIEAPPANPNAIGVYLDKTLVPQSATDGWSFDTTSTSINITGSYCDDLTSGKKTLVEIFLPCKPTDPIPQIIQ